MFLNNNYYVYLFWRKDKNEVFYIGKGKDNRKNSLKNRNKDFLEIYNKTECYSTIYKDNLTEDEAFDLEKKLIAEYKKKGLAYTNIHVGGKGGDTLKWNPLKKQEMIKKCRAASSGENNPMYNKHIKDFMTEEQWNQWLRKMKEVQKKRYEDPKEREKIGKAIKKVWEREGHKEKYHKNNSRVIYMLTDTGEIVKTFIGMEEALKFLNLKSHTTLLKAIRNNLKYKNYYWKREEIKGVSTIESTQIVEQVE